MKSMLKDLLIYSVLFAVVAGGIWFLRGIQKNSMQQAMQLMGERLVAMVAEPGQEEKIRIAFNQFMEKVFDNEISPNQVEEVATNIINLSNNNARLSSAQIETILSIPTLPKVAVSNTGGNDSIAVAIAMSDSGTYAQSYTIIKGSGKGTSSKPVAIGAKPENWTAIGDRIATVFHTNDEFQRILQHSAEPGAEKHALPYLVENNPEKGMQFIISNELKDKEKQGGVASRFAKIKIPNQDELIVWRQNYDRLMVEKKRKLASEMAELKEKLIIKENDRRKDKSDEHKALQHLARLKELEAIAFEIKVDSIVRRIELELHQQLKPPVPPHVPQTSKQSGVKKD